LRPKSGGEISKIDATRDAAGSTGSIRRPATFWRRSRVFRMAAVVLPGLDTDLDDEAWILSAVAPMCRLPQAIRNWPCKHCSKRIGVTRALVAALAAPGPHGRERLVSRR